MPRIETSHALRGAGVMLALALGAMSVRSAEGQALPPSIKRPIDAARNAAAKTNEQTRAAEKVGGEAKTAGGMLPAEAAMAAQKGAPQKGQAGAAGKAPGKAPGDTAQRGAAGQRSSRGTVVFYREAFTYSDQGRRDPFLSLMLTGELRPIFTDVSLIGVIYDPSGRRSVAVILDASTGQTYKVQVGDTQARMKFTKIGPNDLTLQIDEFGFSRTETLVLVKKASTISAPLGKRP